MTYKILKEIKTNFLNENVYKFEVGSTVDRITLDWIFSQNTIEYLILDGYLEEVE